LAPEPCSRAFQALEKLRLAHVNGGDGAALLTRNLEAGSRGEFLDRGGEFEPLELHHETNGIAARAAAEAVVELLVRVDAEGGGFLVVEGAARGVVLTGLAQRHARIHDIDDVDAL
jgi:hypothetical protein